MKPLTFGRIRATRSPTAAIQAREVSAPSTDDFMRSGHQSVQVIGDYLYIDGGEISQYVGENREIADRPLRINETLSISLAQSWTNSTVTIRSLDRGNSPSFKGPGIWPDLQTNSFYEFGGESSFGHDVPERKFWRFFADGSGGGSWKQETPSNPAFFSTLARPAGGSYVKSHDTGFLMGGWGSSWTDQAFGNKDKIAIPGIVSFNFTSTVFANESASAFYSYGTSVWTGAQFLPSFGSNGLILFFGGGNIRDLAYDRSSGTGLLDLNNITVYDPVAKQWHWQAATGDFPNRRERFCSIGVQGPNNTYEIFVYGGYDARRKVAYDDVYVLSLPGFFWSKAQYEPRSPRAHQACALVGKRQMISVGGVDWGLNSTACWFDKDPLQRGLGVFDLTAMSWSDKYDATAASYESPQVVKEWYQQGKISSVAWSSTNVQDFFTGSSLSSSSSPISNSSLSSPTPPPSHSSSGLPVGAIVGIVISVVGFLTLVAIGLFFISRRRRQRRKSIISSVHESPSPVSSPSESRQGWHKPELDVDREVSPSIEMDAVVPVGELESGAVQRHELYSPKDEARNVYELASSDPRASQGAVKPLGKPSSSIWDNKAIQQQI